MTRSVTETVRVLRVLEERLLRAGREAALRNAWAAVQEDQERAAARREAERRLRAAAPAAPPVVLADQGGVRGGLRAP